LDRYLFLLLALIIYPNLPNIPQTKKPTNVGLDD
jgi:hypothetical protein